MRILSTGDWHFNAGYDDDILASVRQIIQHALGVDLIAITGDVYERASEPGSRNLAAECIQQLAYIAPVIVVRGNHDAPGDLEILSKLASTKGITIAETAKTVKVPHHGVVLHLIPWLTKARWQSLHTGTSVEEGDKTVSEMVLDYLKNQVMLNQTEKNILIGHMTIAGAKAENHQQLGADGVTLGLYDIGEAGFYAALLGHIHLNQTLGGPREFYNGSIAALKYGEQPEKFFTILDTDSGEVDWIKLDTIHRQDINASWSSEGVVIDPVDPALLKGARVRANLRVEGGDNTEQAKQQLAEYLMKVNVLDYQINPQVIPVTRVRSVEMASAVSLSEKLFEYWKATEMPENETRQSMLEKLGELEDSCSL